ncbi:MAG: ABC transporter ATP-binding protein [Caulobacterales bacterium]|jgi:ABC-type glutathione transport system ATPase component
MNSLLAIEDAHVRYSRVKAVDGVSLRVDRCEIYGLAGESGSGKSSLARAALGLVPVSGGRILFDGEDVSSAPPARRRMVWRRVGVVFQDPMGSLNPRRSVLSSIGEPLRAWGLARSNADLRAAAGGLLQEVGLDADALDRLPGAFSGGQRQRIAIARALALKPDLLIADEPFAALDVSVQAQVARVFADLARTRGLALLVVSHDLALLYHLADRVGVMQHGRLVEEGPAKSVIAAPRHPYTQALAQASAEPPR